MQKNVTLVLVGLALGCGAGAAATPRATAQGYSAAPVAAAGQRWQQHCEQTGSVQEASQLAAARGVEGYELAALYNGVMCFKRPLAPGGPPPNMLPTWPGY